MLDNQNLGVGTDIENISRFKKLTTDKNNSFLKNIFTRDELDYCFSKKPIASHLAARYAGKEATIKALCSLGKKNLDYKDIEILSDAEGVPIVKVNTINNYKIQTHLSLSHCQDKALAFVVVMELKADE